MTDRGHKDGIHFYSSTKTTELHFLRVLRGFFS